MALHGAASLNLWPDDVLSAICNYLDWESIIKFQVLGNGRLWSRLTGSRIVETMIFSCAATKSSVATLLQFRDLRTLEIRTAKLTLGNDKTCPWLYQLPNSLTDLTIHAVDANTAWTNPALRRNDFGWYTGYGNSMNLPACMQDLFPGLKRLILSHSHFPNIVSDWTTEMCCLFLANLPNSVTELQTSHLEGAMMGIGYSTIGFLRLPLSLTRLGFTQPTHWAADLILKAFKPQTLTPLISFRGRRVDDDISAFRLTTPNLTTLDLSFYSPSLKDHFLPKITELIVHDSLDDKQLRDALNALTPSALTTISLRAQSIQNGHPFISRWMPQFSSLTSLSMVYSPTTVPYQFDFADLPRGLLKLDLFQPCMTVLSFKGLPPTLRGLSLGFLPTDRNRPRSHYLTIDLAHVDDMPSSLKTLSFTAFAPILFQGTSARETLWKNVDTVSLGLFQADNRNPCLEVTWPVAVFVELPRNVTRLHFTALGCHQLPLLPRHLKYLSGALIFDGSCLPKDGSFTHLSKDTVEVEVRKQFASPHLRRNTSFHWMAINRWTPYHAYPLHSNGPDQNLCYDSFQTRVVAENAITIICTTSEPSYYPATITSLDLLGMDVPTLVPHIWAHNMHTIVSTNNAILNQSTYSPIRWLCFPNTLTSLTFTQSPHHTAFARNLPSTLTELVAPNLQLRVLYSQSHRGKAKPAACGYAPAANALPLGLITLDVYSIENALLAPLIHLKNLVLRNNKTIRLPCLPALVSLVHMNVFVNNLSYVLPMISKMPNLRSLEFASLSATRNFVNALPAHIVSLTVSKLLPEVVSWPPSLKIVCHIDLLTRFTDEFKRLQTLAEAIHQS